MRETCQTCEFYRNSRQDDPCDSCPQTVYNNWKEKESPTWKIYVEQKVKEQKMQNLYNAFDSVPDDCQQARFIKGLPAPRTCRLCGLGPCPSGISIKGMKL